MRNGYVNRLIGGRAVVVWALLGSFGGVAGLDAQARAELDGRVASPLRDSVEAILDSAAAAGLPTRLLADKALEGVGKGIDQGRVIAAVRGLRGQLQSTKAALGAVSGAELEAGTSAFRVGVPMATLMALQRALPKRSLVIPYAVLGLMVQKGVPMTDATNTVIAYAKAADDKSLVTFSSAVERNLAAGLPARAALVRAQGQFDQRVRTPIRP